MVERSQRRQGGGGGDAARKVGEEACAHGSRFLCWCVRDEQRRIRSGTSEKMQFFSIFFVASSDFFFCGRVSAINLHISPSTIVNSCTSHSNFAYNIYNSKTYPLRLI